MLAGYETTASALAFGIYLLGKHPHAQKQLLQEVDAFQVLLSPVCHDHNALCARMLKSLFAVSSYVSQLSSSADRGLSCQTSVTCIQCMAKAPPCNNACAVQCVRTGCVPSKACACLAACMMLKERPRPHHTQTSHTFSYCRRESFQSQFTLCRQHAWQSSI